MSIHEIVLPETIRDAGGIRVFRRGDMLRHPSMPGLALDVDGVFRRAKI